MSEDEFTQRVGFHKEEKDAYLYGNKMPSIEDPKASKSPSNTGIGILLSVTHHAVRHDIEFVKLGVSHRFELLDGFIPVSYTHLDVYKRQVQHIPFLCQNKRSTMDILQHSSKV